MVNYSDVGELIQRLEAAVAWLDSYGGKTRNTRWHNYLHDLKAYAPAFQTRDFSKLRTPSAVGFYSSYFEADLLVRIHQAFNGEPRPWLKRQMGYLRDGRSSYLAEGGEARNYGFELWIAALFQRAGYAIDFDEHHDCGLRGCYDGFLTVEAKRPQTEGMLTRRIEEAIDQINRTVLTVPSCEGGVVAICLDKILNKDFKLLQSTSSNLLSEIGESIDSVIDKQEARWKQDYHNKRCLGILFQVRLISTLDDDPTPIVVNASRFVDLIGAGSGVGKFYLEMLEKLSNSINGAA